MVPKTMVTILFVLFAGQFIWTFLAGTGYE